MAIEERTYDIDVLHPTAGWSFTGPRTDRGSAVRRRRPGRLSAALLYRTRCDAAAVGSAIGFEPGGPRPPTRSPTMSVTRHRAACRPRPTLARRRGDTHSWQTTGPCRAGSNRCRRVGRSAGCCRGSFPPGIFPATPRNARRDHVSQESDRRVRVQTRAHTRPRCHFLRGRDASRRAASNSAGGEHERVPHEPPCGAFVGRRHRGHRGDLRLDRAAPRRAGGADRGEHDAVVDRRRHPQL